MGFVREGDPDIFVSYATLDDQDETRWVTNLVSRLENDLISRLGTREVKLWWDQVAIARNRPFPSQILDAVRRSATLLVVMSEGYLASDWCARERNTFLNIARDFVADGRIFIVHYRDTDRNARPPEFRNLLGHQFWTKEPGARGAHRPLGWPELNERAYWTKFIDLSTELVRKLKEIKGDPGREAVHDPVLLARSTDDLSDREEELKSYLSQAGVSILPETRYPDPEDDEAGFRAAIKADLGRCSSFVQLLSGIPGRKVGSGRRFPLMQYDIAREAKKPILQWRDRAANPAEIADMDHRALVEGARAGGFEEFKRAVVEAARRKPESLPPPPPPGTVFVNADRDDLGLARQISALLGTQGFESYLPIFEGTPEKVRRNRVRNLRACDGFILVYGIAPPTWVQGQLLQRRKSRERAFAAQALYLAPPPEKAPLGGFPEVMELDGRRGLTPEIMREFIDKLSFASASSRVEG
jgi:hypothetical protein